MSTDHPPPATTAPTRTGRTGSTRTTAPPAPGEPARVRPPRAHRPGGIPPDLPTPHRHGEAP